MHRDWNHIIVALKMLFVEKINSRVVIVGVVVVSAEEKNPV